MTAKIKAKSTELPTVTKREVDSRITKSKRIALRVTEDDFDEIKSAASQTGLTVTDYLVNCGKLVSEKLKK